MRLSVVIPAYNSLDKVLRCVNTLQRYQSIDNRWYPPQQYTIQDDASPQYDFCELIPPMVASVYRNDQNVGFNGNVGAGVNNSKEIRVYPGNYEHGELIAIVNQDVFAVPELSQDWDTRIIAAFDDEQVGIVGPRLLFPNGAIQSAAGEFDGKGQPTHRFLGYSDITYEPANTPEYVDWITGAFMVVRRSVWEQLGGFDPIYAPSYFEDVDLCLRARELGYKTFYEPRCTFIHEVGSTGGSPHFGRSAAAFYERWVATGKVKPSTPAIRERFW